MIRVEAKDARETFARWIREGNTIGVFSNHDLSSHNVGHRIFMPMDPENAIKAIAGVTRAPDGSYGLGWRYILDSIEKSVDAFEFVEPAPDPIPTEHRWISYTYDVWGNATEGYEVNNVFRGEEVSTSEELTDSDVRKIARDSGFGRCKLEIDGDDETITVNRERDGMPLFEIRREPTFA